MKNKHRLVILFALFFVFFGCKKDWNELGSQFIVQDELAMLYYDNQIIRFSLEKEDSLSTLNRPTFFLGSIIDPVYGSSEASIFSELSLMSSNVDFDPTSQADSIILLLDLEGYYGDTTSVLHFSVMEMLEQIETSGLSTGGEDSLFSIFSFEEFIFSPVKLGETEFSYSNSLNNEIRIPLSIDLAQRFLDASAENLTNNDEFQTFFKGLHIACSPVYNGGLFVELDASQNSKLRLYYHTSETDSLTYDFKIDNNADKMTHWSHIHSLEIESLIGAGDISSSFVQGGVGLRTYINFPELSSLKDSNFVVHKAELILPFVTTEADSIYKLPERLGLAAFNADGNLEVLNDDQNIQGLAYFNGFKNEINKSYSFNIARYVEKVISEDYTTELALYIPNSISQPHRVKLSNEFSENFNGAKLMLFVSKY